MAIFLKFIFFSFLKGRHVVNPAPYVLFIVHRVAEFTSSTAFYERKNRAGKGRHVVNPAPYVLFFVHCVAGLASSITNLHRKAMLF